MNRLFRIIELVLILLIIAARPVSAGELLYSPTFSYQSDLQAGPADIIYDIDLTAVNDHLIGITIRLTGLNRSDVKLIMPAWTARYSILRFGRYVMEISAETEEGNPVHLRQDALGEWIVETEGISEVEIKYRVYANEPSPFAAQLNPAHAFINPAALLMYLPDRINKQLLIRFEVPPGWEIATTLEPSFDPEIFRATSFEQLADSPVLASRFQEQLFTTHGMNVTVVFDGIMPGFNQRGLIQGLQRLITKAIDLFGAVPASDYLFLIHFTEGRMEEAVGHRSSTVVHWGLHNRDESLNSLLRKTLCAFLHSWLGKRIHPRTSSGPGFTGPQVIDSLWFLDGAAEYYAELLLTRTGLQPSTDFLRRVGTEITVLQNTRARTIQSAMRASEEVWYRDDDWYRSPDRSIDHRNKGFLLVFLLDLEMRQATENSRSLDDLMSFMSAWYGGDDRSFDGSGAIIRAAGALAETDLTEFLEKYISGLEELPFGRILELGGWSIRPVAEEVATTGFRTESEWRGALLVTSVEEHSPAARAGLRLGDRIVAVNGSFQVGNLQEIVASSRPGDLLTLRIQRRMTEEEMVFALGQGNRQSYVVEPIPSPTPQQRAIGAGLLSGLP